MLEPVSMSPGSIMPPYPWLFEKSVDAGTTNSKIHAMRRLGVPYPKNYEAKANDDMKKQAKSIAESLAKDKIVIQSDKEIIALIAYLQRMGTDIKAKN